MTHLRIEQNNGITEQVSPSVIEKLYEIVHSGNLDSSSNLMGSLNTTGTYLDYVDYLEELFTKNGVRLLIITANKLYMTFADPVVFSRMMQYLGDGVGITSSEITNGNWYSNTTDPNTNSTLFTNNTSITSFNELGDLSLITSIPNNTFNGCTNLADIDLSNITSIGYLSFLNSGITEADLSSLLTFTADTAFKGCTNLETVVIGSGITSIPKDTFSGCTSLENITLPNTITNLGLYSFYNCNSLLSITLPSSITTVAKNCFQHCTSLLTINIPNATSFGELCFYQCSSLTTADLLSATSLGNLMFRECTNLINVNLPSSITTLPSMCFNNCSSLRCIDLTNVTLVNEVFNGCSSLVDLTTNDPNNINTGAETYTFNWISINNGFNDTALTNKSFNFPELLYVGQNAFLRSGLVSLNMPKLITTGRWCFSDCKSLQTVAIGDFITTLDSYAFAGCTALTTVTFGSNSSFVLNDYCFNLCSNLTSIVNITNCTKIGSRAFYNCTSLGTNEILELNLTNQTSNPENAFYGTKYKGLILHWTNYFTSSYRANYPLWELMNELEYLDISDTHWSQNATNVFSFYGSKKIKTVIFSPDTNQIALPNISDERPQFLHLIVLSDSVVTIELQNKQDRMFRSDYAPNLIIYVPDSLVSSYLADSNWSLISNISTHLKGLSDLPAGVWTTGLASLYLTPAQLATS